MKSLNLGLTAMLGLLCLLVSCKSPDAPGGQTDKYYTVSFESGGGTVISDKTVLEGTTLNLTLTEYKPLRSGYLFDGWFVQGDTVQTARTSITVNENITLVAMWTRLFSVTLEMGEGGALGSNPNLYFTLGALFEPSSYRPFRKGFFFLHWYLKNDPSMAEVGSFRIDGDITLVAKWEEGWAVTFELNGGVYSRNYITVAKGDNVTISLANINPVKDDNVFDGWYYDEYFTDPVLGDTATVTGDISLYVKWIPLSMFSSLLGVWRGDDGTYFLYFEESRLYGFYFSLDDIRSFTWTSSTLDGKRYSPVAPLSVGEGEDAKTFAPVTEKRRPAGNVPLNGTWVMAGADDNLLQLYLGGGIALYLSDNGTGSIRANSRYLEINYVVTNSGNLFLLKKYAAVSGVLPEGEVLLGIPIEEGKPSGFEKLALIIFRK